jgi:hypothetical protein
MKNVVCAAALLAAAGAANAAVFGVRAVDTNSLGSPIVVTGTLFQSTAAGNTQVGGPSGDAIEASSANQNLEFDSYVAIDSGPSAPGNPQVKGDGFQANPGDLSNIGAPFANPATVAAVWFMDPAGPRPTFNAPANSLFAGQNAAFLGRFSFRTTTGTTPSGSIGLGANGLVVDIRDFGTIGAGPGSTDSLLVRFTSFNTTVQVGTDGADLQQYPTGLPYQLQIRTSSAGPLAGGTARWLVQDLYVVQIPTPGTLALAGLGALVAGRRRRA